MRNGSPQELLLSPCSFNERWSCSPKTQNISAPSKTSRPGRLQVTAGAKLSIQHERRLSGELRVHQVRKHHYRGKFQRDDSAFQSYNVPNNIREADEGEAGGPHLEWCND